MEMSDLRNAAYPGFDRALVERSWTYLQTCSATRVYDSENVRIQCLKEFPGLHWEKEVIPAICEGITSVQKQCKREEAGVARPLMIRCLKLQVKIPVDLRFSLENPSDGIAAVMALLPINALPESIRFGDPSYLEEQDGKRYDEAIESLRLTSERKKRFFTCNEIDHHMFTHVFDNGSYSRSFILVEV